jgi:3-oxoadipate enol-lactonase/4-carboxymuconolactone decarboxylase
MAFVDVGGLRCYYRLEGVATRPVLVLSHSLGLDHSMWDPQMPDLTARFRVLRYDIRGHGGTDAPAGEYTIEALGRDAVALLDRLGVERAAWCGLSLGGMIGQWLAVHAASRLSHLVLANTSPRIADPPGMEARRQTVLAQGMPAVVETAMARFFGPELVDRNPPAVASARETFLSTNAIGYAGCCAALRDVDQTASLAGVRTPTLVIGGDADAPMPWDGHGAVLSREIPGAKAVRLPAAHISNIGAPRAFTRAVLDFLDPPPADAFEAGLEIRRTVLGRDYVERALSSGTDLTKEFQELITRNVWGAIWTRPGLDHRTRRLLVLAVTAALGRGEEFRLHLAAGLDHGLEWSDVEEVLLQTAVYAGAPAANTGFHIAAEERARRK